MPQLLFFGKLGDLAGGRTRDISIPKPETTVAQLISLIGDDDPALGGALRDASVRIVVNEQFSSLDTVISENDEVAFLPPVSGG